MPCHWDPPEPTIEQELETGLIDLTRYLEGRTPVTTYRDRHLAGLHRDPNSDEELTVEQLKAGLKALDQPVSGSKAELEKRLAEAQKTA
jgi:hypothetical protein